MSENNSIVPKTLPGIQINIRDFLDLCINHWWWFVASTILCLLIAGYKIVKTPPVYSRSATLLIKETSTRRQANDLETVLGTGGLTSANSKITNELVAFRSPALMEDVVRRAKLNINYVMKARRYDNVLYGSTCPIIAEFPEMNDNARCSFDVQTLAKGGYILKNFKRNGEELENDMEIKVESGDTIVTPVGIVILHTTHTAPQILNRLIRVDHWDVKTAAAVFSKRLEVEADDIKNMSDILDLTLVDVNIERADKLLSTLIDIYNENWVNDRNKTAAATSEFINDRLASLDNELSNVDSNISTFKSRNLLPDINTASSMYLSQGVQNDAKIQELENQLYIINYIYNSLNNKGKRQMIPLADNISNSSLSQLVANYNTTLMQRNNLASNSSEQNPIVVDMDSSLDAIKSTIIASVDNQVNSLKSQLATLRRAAESTTARIAASPNQEKYLLNIGRQQKVKESLYLYLLQKREENELSQAFTAYNTRLITPPSGSSVPIAPNTRKILLIALLIGISIPLIYLYVRETLNTKVRGRKDLEGMAVPLLGEIPQYFDAAFLNMNMWERTKDRYEKVKKKVLELKDLNDLKHGKKKQKKEEKGSEVRTILVKHGKRDTINEAFRVLRTNIEFISNDKDSKVMLLTSFNISSGKTFVTANLAMAMAIKGMKILAIDGDIRHASLSNYVNNPKKGLSDYLAGKEKNIDNLIVKGVSSSHLDILPCGTIPPNPAELLGNSKFAELVSKLRESYEYIFIDCPPVEIVADTQIIEKCVDRSIFVIRSGLFDKTMIPEMEKYYQENKFKKMMAVLNGSGAEGTYYGNHYGYGYYGYYRKNVRYGYYGGYGKHSNGYYGYYNKED